MGRWIETGDPLDPWQWVRDEPTEALPTAPPLPRRVPGATVLPPAPEPVDAEPDLPPTAEHLAPFVAPDLQRYANFDVAEPHQETPVSIAKTLVAALAAVLAAILPGLTTDVPLGLAGIVNVIVLAAGAIQVFNAANIPGWPVAKLIAAAVAAAGVVVISAWSDQVITSAEWVQIALAVLGALGVWAVPNSRPAVVGVPDKRLYR